MQYPDLFEVKSARARSEPVQAEIVRHLLKGWPFRIAGNALLSVATSVLLVDSLRADWLKPWLALQGALLLWQLVWWPRKVAVAPASAASALRHIALTEAAGGLLWMVGLALLLPGVDIVHRAMMLILLLGLLMGTMPSLSVSRPALVGASVPPAVGFLLGVASEPGPYLAFGTVSMVAWLTVHLTYAHQMGKSVIESLHSRHCADMLAAHLQTQTDRAVALSQSRGRFLATASHDLRQPVHALSLFVGALKQQPPAPEAHRLLMHVGETVDAMGAMFNGLLDLSRLDAGMVQPHSQPFQLAPLLSRLATEHAEAARAKGLAFGWHIDDPEELVVRSDPALLERVLRNLLGNALRYTQRGSVMLSVRQRTGQVLIRIADTGVGIAASQRVSVFQEFVQLRETADERETGLGLGLAIVQRLCGLLNIGVGLRSRVGRGTVFSLRLQRAGGGALTCPTAPALSEAGARASCRLQAGDVVLFVDDAPEIRLAMSALLTGWGARVLAAESLTALLPQLLVLSTKPRLLICDYALRGGENGLTVIEQLRSDYNEDLPAILVTGDTAPERLCEADAIELRLLHKPVTEASLQAAIAAALGDGLPAPTGHPALADGQPQRASVLSWRAPLRVPLRQPVADVRPSAL